MQGCMTRLTREKHVATYHDLPSFTYGETIKYETLRFLVIFIKGGQWCLATINHIYLFELLLISCVRSGDENKTNLIFNASYLASIMMRLVL